MHAIGHRLTVLLAATVLALAAAAVHAHRPAAGEHCDDDAISRPAQARGLDSIGARNQLHCHHGGCGDIATASTPPRIDPLVRPEAVRAAATAKPAAPRPSSGYEIVAVHTPLYILFESLLI